MTRRDPIQHAADSLIAAVWWLDRRLPVKCRHCRARKQARHIEGHVAIDHAGDPEWGD